MSRLQIAVVGGSIAGCCIAIELTRAGHRVEVFERSVGSLVGQGAGIGLLPQTLDALLKRDLVDVEIPRFELREQVLLGRSASEPVMGRASLRLPLLSWSLSWADLYRSLRARVPETMYRAGAEVRGIEAHACSAELIFADASRRTFDLVVFADGHASLGRRHVCPEVTSVYRGYVLWRGVVAAAKLTDLRPLEHSLVRVSYGVTPGHAAFYRIPSGAGAAADGGGLVNFACYVPVQAHELSQWLVDRQGQTHTSSVAPGGLAVEVEARMRAFAQEHLPEYYAQIVLQSQDTFLQAVFSAHAHRYHAQRVCLLGDASTLAPPFTASGVMKAATAAIDLGRTLRKIDDPDEALAAWDSRQRTFGDALFALGEHMEQPFVWNTPDFASLEPAAALQWWQASTGSGQVAPPSR